MEDRIYQIGEKKYVQRELSLKRFRKVLGIINEFGAVGAVDAVDGMDFKTIINAIVSDCSVERFLAIVLDCDEEFASDEFDGLPMSIAAQVITDFFALNTAWFEILSGQFKRLVEPSNNVPARSIPGSNSSSK